MENSTSTTPNPTFLPLKYTDHFFGSPIEAQSELIAHAWNEPDNVHVHAEFTIEAGREELVNGYDIFHVWVKREEHYWPEEYTAISWYQSPTFHNFDDAEAYAQFAYQRWQATGYLSSSAMELRDDLDERRNPVD